MWEAIAEYAKENISGKRVAELTDEVNQKFNVAIKPDTLLRALNKRNIYFGKKDKSKRLMLLTPEQFEFFKQHHKGKTSQEFAQIMVETFNIKLTASQVSSIRTNHKMPSGVDTRFKKGSEAWNKGKKFPGTGNITTFKKGHVPYKVLKDGAERITRDGYIEVKCQRKWIPKHRIIYEKHYGKIPKDHFVFFIDQDKTNLDINNLIAISYQECAYLNKNLKLNTDASINRAKIYLAKLQQKARGVKKCKNQKTMD